MGCQSSKSSQNSKNKDQKQNNNQEHNQTTSHTPQNKQIPDQNNLQNHQKLELEKRKSQQSQDNNKAQKPQTLQEKEFEETQQMIEKRRESILNERIQANKLGLSRSKYDDYLKFLKDNNLEENEQSFKQFQAQMHEQYQQQIQRRKSFQVENIKGLTGNQNEDITKNRNRAYSQDYQKIQEKLKHLPQTQKKSDNFQENIKIKNRLSVFANQQQQQNQIQQELLPQQLRNKSRKGSRKHSTNQHEKSNTIDQFDDLVNQINAKESIIQKKHRQLTPNFTLQNHDYIKEVSDLGIGEQLAMVWNQLSQNEKKEQIKKLYMVKENKQHQPTGQQNIIQNRRNSENYQQLISNFNKNQIENRRTSLSIPQQRRSLFQNK